MGAGSVADTIRGPLEQLTQNQSAGFALIIGLAGALWSASGYVGAFGRAMNRIYEIREGRPFWKLRPLMIVITLAAVILAGLVAIGLVISGPVARAIGDAIGLGETAVTVWNVLKWPVLLGLAALVVAILYYATPNVRQPKFRWISVGAAVAIITWVVASALFGVYVSNFASYNKTYGSLAGVIIFLLWLWITNLALLFGAELDAEIERGRQLQAGIAAEHDIQLPPRDTRVIDKTDAKDDVDIEQGRELRRSRGESGLAAVVPPSLPPGSAQRAVVDEVSGDVGDRQHPDEPFFLQNRDFGRRMAQQHREHRGVDELVGADHRAHPTHHRAGRHGARIAGVGNTALDDVAVGQHAHETVPHPADRNRSDALRPHPLRGKHQAVEFVDTGRRRAHQLTGRRDDRVVQFQDDIR